MATCRVVTAALLSSCAAIAYLASSGTTLAACTTAGLNVSCSGAANPLAPSYANGANNLNVTVNPGGSVGVLLGVGGNAMTLTGSNLTVINNGGIDPVLLGTGLGVVSSGVVMGNAAASTQTFTNNGALGGSTGFSVGLNGMALAVQNGTGGTTNITNTGTMSTSGVIGATLLGPDAGVLAAYGGAQINVDNSGMITGRVALGSSAGGNTFTNSGTVNGSVSLGANSANQFIATTGSSVNAAGGTASEVNLGIGATTINFAATGMVDGGAGGNNTLTLQQGVAAVGTIDNTRYLNFNHLDVQSGVWSLTGASGASDASLGNGTTAVIYDALSLGTGTITSNGGTIQAGVSGLTLANGISASNGFVVFGPNDLEISGIISGTSSLTKLGSGTLTLSGSNSYYGPTYVNAGTLALKGSGSLGLSRLLYLTSAGAIFDISDANWVQPLDGLSGVAGTEVALGTNTLLLLNASDHLFAGSITGTGSLSKLGAGTLFLSGASTFTGTTTVQQGALELVNGSLAAPVVVTASATFSGIGSLSNLLVGSNGIVSPGTSVTPVGTLDVNGDLSFFSDSTFALDIGADGRSDRINATRVATLLGGTISINALDPTTSYQQDQTYTVLSAAGGVSGTFANVATTSAFLDLYTTYTPTDVQLTIVLAGGEPSEETPVVFEREARTPNQRAVARSLDTLEQSGDSLALYNKMLGLSADDARAAYDELGGVVHASGQSGLVRNANAINNTINNRLRSVSNGVAATPVAALGYVEEKTVKPENDPFASYDAKSTAGTFDPNRFAIWGTGLGSWGKIDGTEGAADTDTRTTGLLIGADGMISEQWRAGLFGGYSYSSFDTGANEQRSKNYHVGAYADSHWGNASFRAGINYTHHDTDTSRVVSTLGEAIGGNYNGNTLSAFGEVAYRFDLEKTAFEPFAAVSHTYNKTSSFNETGGLAALAVDGDTMNTTATTIGIRTATNFELNETAVVARGTLGWVHAFGDVAPISTARFATGEAFSVSGTPVDRNAALIKLGLDFALSQNATLGLGFNGQIGSKAYDHAFNAGLKVRF